MSASNIAYTATAIPCASTVIPAKAGIHTPPYRHAGPLPGFWIPACAGMTVGEYLHPTLPTRDPYMLPHPVIPAKAGIHTPTYRHAEVPPPGFWIPAYAGMTVGKYRQSGITYPQPHIPHPPPAISRPLTHPVIPAKAGIHTPPCGRRAELPAASVHPELVAGRTDAGRNDWRFVPGLAAQSAVHPATSSGRTATHLRLYRRPTPSNLCRNPAYPIPPPPHPDRHPIIPAKAGIRTPAYRYAEVPPPGFWIPACAEMTVGNMSVSNITYPQPPYAAPTPSFPRKRESIPRPIASPSRYRGSGFRPALEWRWGNIGNPALPICNLHTPPHAVIPAKAGIHTHPAATPSRCRDSGFRPAPE